MLPEFRPAHANYAFKAAMYGFNYKAIVALNLRWMRLPKGQRIQCRVGLVEALAESDTTIRNPEITVGSAKMTIPAELKTGDYAEFWADGSVRLFDRNGALLSTKGLGSPPATLPSGETRIGLQSAVAGPTKFTVITLGESLR